VSNTAIRLLKPRYMMCPILLHSFGVAYARTLLEFSLARRVQQRVFGARGVKLDGAGEVYSEEYNRIEGWYSWYRSMHWLAPRSNADAVLGHAGAAVSGTGPGRGGCHGPAVCGARSVAGRRGHGHGRAGVGHRGGGGGTVQLCQLVLAIGLRKFVLDRGGS
jgi:hypothetical protein